jgi:myo-inositol-1-phosphate synthase
MLERMTIPVVASSGGAVDIKTDTINGYIERIEYVKDNFADTVDFDLYVDGPSGQVLWQEDNVTASDRIHPRVLCQDPTDTDATGIYDRVALANQVVNIVVANAGNATRGTFEIVYNRTS